MQTKKITVIVLMNSLFFIPISSQANDQTNSSELHNWDLTYQKEYPIIASAGWFEKAYHNNIIDCMSNIKKNKNYIQKEAAGNGYEIKRVRLNRNNDAAIMQVWFPFLQRYRNVGLNLNTKNQSNTNIHHSGDEQQDNYGLKWDSEYKMDYPIEKSVSTFKKKYRENIIGTLHDIVNSSYSELTREIREEDYEIKKVRLNKEETEAVLWIYITPLKRNAVMRLELQIPKKTPTQIYHGNMKDMDYPLDFTSADTWRDFEKEFKKDPGGTTLGTFVEIPKTVINNSVKSITEFGKNTKYKKAMIENVDDSPWYLKPFKFKNTFDFFDYLGRKLGIIQSEDKTTEEEN